jgi:hypothetical protein
MPACAEAARSTISRDLCPDRMGTWIAAAAAIEVSAIHFLHLTSFDANRNRLGICEHGACHELGGFQGRERAGRTRRKTGVGQLMG